MKQDVSPVNIRFCPYVRYLRVAKYFGFFLYESPAACSHSMLNTFSLTERQSVLTHTVRQNGVPTLLDAWVTNTPSVKMSCPQKIYFCFRKNATCVLAC